ncbi:hypothetical protein GCM10010913_05290 [Paenibacillus aceti]|uniref:Tryptophan RNA-binding attenuation protein n=1 Tax=Paenibacillus aceti TaxID=1820010 RepID=A0ABQ1VPG0_9BACL|nr:hypothetical protein GCM10010913_05290 [Paenibacillus aceti]
MTDKCEKCDDKQYLRIEGTNILVPCTKCNPHGHMQVVPANDVEVISHG